ncbi:MAG: DUF2007 domain-containing protein [Alphaproteobacteria bacterium]
MKELLRTNDPVALSWFSAILADAGIDSEIFDTHASILDGSVLAIPRRIMVSDADFEQATVLLEEMRAAGHPL